MGRRSSADDVYESKQISLNLAPRISFELSREGVPQIYIKPLQDNDQHETDITPWGGKVAYAFLEKIPVVRYHGVAISFTRNTRRRSLQMDANRARQAPNAPKFLETKG